MTPNTIMGILVSFVIVLFFCMTMRKMYVLACTQTEERAVLDKVHDHLRRVYPQIPENVEIRNGYYAFTENKRVITLCMYDPETAVMYPFEKILYVAIHELAHVISESYSIDTHNAEFMVNFDKLIARAVGLGMIPAGYHVNDTYCKL